MVKKVGKYELGRTLGEGTFGKVKMATDTETGEQVAIKILEKAKIVKQGMVEQIKKEISILKMVHNKYIVNLIDVLASTTKIYMVLELITGGELFYKLAKEGRFDEDTARMYFQQLMIGLKYCHEQGVTHRDLKPENILLDANNNLKISDFGLSALYEGGDADVLLHTTCGTPNYVAPEVISDKGYEGSAADIWSCGVILYVFLAGFLPFEDPSTTQLFKKIQRAEFRFPAWFSAEARALIGKILVPDPAERITLVGIMNDPWFTIGLTAEMREDMRGAGAPVAVIDEHMADVEEEDTDPRTKTTNAFDLIGMSGAFDLTRMLEKNPNDMGRVQRHTRFTSETAPDDILARLSALLGERQLQFKVLHKSYSIKVTAPTPQGPIPFTIKIYEMVNKLYMVDFEKQKGSVLEFYKIYKDLHDGCGAIISQDR